MLAPHLRLNDKCVNKFICHLTTLYALLNQFIEYLPFLYLNFLQNSKNIGIVREETENFAQNICPCKKENLIIVCFGFFNFIRCILREKRSSPGNIVTALVINDSSSIYVLCRLLDYLTNCDADFSL